ncbi:MAG TPA: molybdate ABC transporter substrate-binding protein [Opitutaceae bacterium]|nr:molybdate ABC transporter substrate-binding protein [Opitutaceae bacterium]
MKRLFVFLLAGLALTARAEKVTIAAAANLVYCLDALKPEFARAAPGTELVTITGSSGNLVAQIKNGAPFDVFLSADVDFPQQLVNAGLAGQDSVSIFATGRLVLWTKRADLPLTSLADAVRSPQVAKLALANPQTAPYGRAAEEAMKRLGVWADARPKLVVGENISQTLQFVDTGNADAGFVALSLLLSPKLRGTGRYVEVPPGLYGSLAHGGVLTKRGATNPGARRFLEFLASEPARKILTEFGYRVPAK